MRRTRKNPFRSRAQQRWAYAALARGELTKKQLKEMKKGTVYSSLPEYVSKKGKKMARRKTRHRTRRHPSRVSRAAFIRRLRSRIMARTKSRRNPYLVKGDPHSFYHPGIKKVEAAKLYNAMKAGAITRKEYDEELVRIVRRPREEYRVKSTLRARRRKLATIARRWAKKHGYRKGARKLSAAQLRRLRLRNLKKARRVRARNLRKHGRRTQKRRPAGRKRRYHVAKRKGRKGRKRTAAQLRRLRLRNLKKARRARMRNLRKRHRPSKRYRRYVPRKAVRRIVRRVKRLRPGISRRRIARVVSHDITGAAHRRHYGRRARRALVKDALFELDFRRTARAQRIGPAFQKRAMRRVRRHPAHTRLRGLPRHVVKGWKEFAGYRPNFVATIKRSPVHGSFNGVTIRQLIGTTMHSRRRVIIRPSSGRPIYLIWSNGARTFSVVGAPPAMSELANDFARVGEPIILRHIDYIAFRYIAGRGERRSFRKTPTKKMGITFTHKVTHRAILQWNGKLGDAAIFPIRVSGARHRKLVDRAGIHI